MPDVQLTRHVNCPAIHKIKQFHLSDIPFVHKSQNSKYVFPDNSLIKSFGSIYLTFLESLWPSSKQNYVLCLSYFYLGFLEGILLQRIFLDMHKKLFEKVQQAYSIYKCTVFKLKILNLQIFSSNALLYVQILSYFELFEYRTIEFFCVTA